MGVHERTDFSCRPGTLQAHRIGRRSKGKSARARASKNVRNSLVNFRICDAYVPEPLQILMELHGEDLLHGKIIDVSESGSQGEQFVVVEVERLAQPVVVPMKHVRGIPSE
jgi:hypothetical protein